MHRMCLRKNRSLPDVSAFCCWVIDFIQQIPQLFWSRCIYRWIIFKSKADTVLSADLKNRLVSFRTLIRRHIRLPEVKAAKQIRIKNLCVFHKLFKTSDFSFLCLLISIVAFIQRCRDCANLYSGCVTSPLYGTNQVICIRIGGSPSTDRSSCFVSQMSGQILWLHPDPGTLHL